MILSPKTAYANGRATLVSSQEQGPYRIDVSIIPGRAVLFNTHISILIRSLADETIITQASVSVSATGQDVKAEADKARACFLDSSLPVCH